MKDSIKHYKKQMSKNLYTKNYMYQENTKVQLVYEKCKQHENPEKLYQKARYRKNSENEISKSNLLGKSRN